MVHIECLWSFRSLAELSSKPEVGASGFPFYSFKKANREIGKRWEEG
jgi:hypothetical protein